MNRIAFLLRVSAQAVLNWIRTFAQKYQEKPKPTGRSIILELMGYSHERGEERHVVCCLWRILGMIWQLFRLDSCESLRCGLASRHIPTVQLGVARLERNAHAAWGRSSRAWQYVSKSE